MSEEQGFEVVDKRRVNADGTPRETSAGEGSTGNETQTGAESGPGASAEAGTAAGEQEAPGAGPGTTALGPPIAARDVVVFCVSQLHDIAWSRMGLVPNPISGTFERDLADARLAIDCVADLIARLEPLADATVKRELQNMLANLRLNFVQQSQRG